MIFYLGGNQMIIKKLTVMKLHGLYDYTVRFHDDLTFLYGENGCGKTTILNIISSIVTGELYSLSSYRFDTITLAYYDPSARRSHTLHIKSEDNGYLLRLNPQGKEERIPLLVVDPDYSENNSISSLRQKYMRSYEFPQLLRSTFSYLYLPLSRYFQGETGMGNTLSRYRYASYTEREFESALRRSAGSPSAPGRKSGRPGKQSGSARSALPFRSRPCGDSQAV